MRSVIFLLLGCAVACSPDDETYKLDGVPVVLVEGVGPDKLEMTLAVETYRTRGAIQFDMSPAEEIDVWHKLSEIRWTEGTVPGGGVYNPDTGKIKLRWYECAVTGELYPTLTEHYSFVATGMTEHLGSRDWAKQLAAEVAPIVCSDE